ncbi:Cyclic nucleotide-binding domain-containing protein [Andreprevotia lacus DSM 23236]|jgi:CRP-like cAMP-binding protein|uniref:Cyclic nucleotide-binding domain-containing protein n=1 Tax=Andreprevotia lacus DSM 23236 TaxID=1121001 RepID=A0A1W1XYL5_9NEIS|nr:cyclic nucleotide-binding domain-containing protein [Andreprevotia lacus]SMC28651.1 Cyclic nucleotide-binding domain-containing protein [Andreprevotia lacus DSM 23236]
MLSDALLHRLRNGVALLHDFSDDDVREFVGHCSAQNRSAGERIIAEGEHGRAMYIVLAGTLRVLNTAVYPPVQLAELAAGDTFGELALLDFGARSACVDTLTEVRLLEFDRSQLVRIPLLQTKLYHNLALMLAERLRETNALVGMLAAGTRGGGMHASQTDAQAKRQMLNRH